MARLTTQGLKLQRTVMVSSDYQKCTYVYTCSSLGEPRTQIHILTSRTDVIFHILADQRPTNKGSWKILREGIRTLDLNYLVPGWVCCHCSYPKLNKAKLMFLASQCSDWGHSISLLIPCLFTWICNTFQLLFSLLWNWKTMLAREPQAHQPYGI